MTMQLQQITMNLSAKGTRTDFMAGNEYLVVPAVMIVEGVLNGSKGPLFYPAGELEIVPQVWNMKPVVVYHPGDGSTATEWAYLENSQIGILMNTKFNKKTKKLHSEVWLDVDRTAKVDNRILESIAKGEKVEVSTGLYTQNEAVAGEHNGVEYTAIARNIRPDHLAILPDLTGACSIADGAGLLCMNSRQVANIGLRARFVKSLEDAKISKEVIEEVRNSLSFSNTHSALQRDLNERHGEDTWVEDTYDDFVIFQNDGGLFKSNYTSNETEVVLSPDPPVEVKRVTEYRTIDGTFVGNDSETDNDTPPKTLNTGDPNMDRTESIKELIANEANQWAAEDTEFLTELNDDQFAKVQEKSTLEVNEETPAVIPATTVEKPAENSGEESLDDYVAKAPAAMRDVLTSSIRNHNDQKIDLIKKISAHENNQFSADSLAAKSLEDLQGIAAFLPAPKAEQNVATLTPDFSGAAVGANNRVIVKDEEPLTLPVYNWEEKESVAS